MKKIPFLLILGVIAGCPKPPSPGSAAVKFWQEVLAAEYVKVYDRFSFMDRAVKSREEFIQELTFKPEESSVFRVSIKLTSFKIGEAIIVVDSAQVPVTITVPDAIKDKYRRFLWKVTRETTADTTLRPRMATLEGWTRLVREDNAWFIFGDWETERKIAGELARQRLEYLAKLKIQNVRVREDQNVRKYYLTFDLVNTGTRNLKFAQVLITCLNKDGHICQVLTENPVSDKTRPLAAGERRRVKLDLTTTPVEWNMQTEIKAVDCGFAE
jgi:hypothetical protein